MDWEDASTISNQPETESSKIPKPSLPKAKDYKTATEPLRLCKLSLISQIQAFQFDWTQLQSTGPTMGPFGSSTAKFPHVFFLRCQAVWSGNLWVLHLNTSDWEECSRTGQNARWVVALATTVGLSSLNLGWQMHYRYSILWWYEILGQCIQVAQDLAHHFWYFTPRSRQVDAEVNGGTPCDPAVPTRQSEECSLPCPRDCVWGDWGAWSRLGSNAAKNRGQKLANKSKPTLIKFGGELGPRLCGGFVAL